MIYGTSDGGKTIVNKDEKFDELMRQTAEVRELCACCIHFVLFSFFSFFFTEDKYPISLLWASFSTCLFFILFYFYFYFILFYFILFYFILT